MAEDHVTSFNLDQALACLLQACDETTAHITSHNKQINNDVENNDVDKQTSINVIPSSYYDVTKQFKDVCNNKNNIENKSRNDVMFTASLHRRLGRLYHAKYLDDVNENNDYVMNSLRHFGISKRYVSSLSRDKRTKCSSNDGKMCDVNYNSNVNNKITKKNEKNNIEKNGNLKKSCVEGENVGKILLSDVAIGESCVLCDCGKLLEAWDVVVAVVFGSSFGDSCICGINSRGGCGDECMISGCCGDGFDEHTRSGSNGGSGSGGRNGSSGNRCSSGRTGACGGSGGRSGGRSGGSNSYGSKTGGVRNSGINCNQNDKNLIYRGVEMSTLPILIRDLCGEVGGGEGEVVIGQRVVAGVVGVACLRGLGVCEDFVTEIVCALVECCGIVGCCCCGEDTTKSKYYKNVEMGNNNKNKHFNMNKKIINSIDNYHKNNNQNINNSNNNNSNNNNNNFYNNNNYKNLRCFVYDSISTGLLLMLLGCYDEAYSIFIDAVIYVTTNGLTALKVHPIKTHATWCVILRLNYVLRRFVACVVEYTYLDVRRKFKLFTYNDFVEGLGKRGQRRSRRENNVVKFKVFKKRTVLKPSNTNYNENGNVNIMRTGSGLYAVKIATGIRHADVRKLPAQNLQKITCQNAFENNRSNDSLSNNSLSNNSLLSKSPSNNSLTNSNASNNNVSNLVFRSN